MRRDRSVAAPVTIRPRVLEDMKQCAALAGVVHACDGYPPHLPDDLGAFLARPVPLGAWVAVENGAIVGHVALNPTSSEPVMACASEATGLPTGDLAAVARLLVAPAARRRGVGGPW